MHPIHAFQRVLVRHHHRVRAASFNRADGRLYRRVGVVGGRPDVVLVARNAEQQDARHAFGARRLRFLHGFIHRQLKNAWHGCHFAADVLAFDDEKRIEELIGGQTRFADEAADAGGSAEPPRAPHEIQRVPGLCPSPFCSTSPT